MLKVFTKESIITKRSNYEIIFATGMAAMIRIPLFCTVIPRVIVKQ